MKRWQYILTGAVAGAVLALVGAYAFSRPIFLLTNHSVYLSAASQGTLDVAALRKIRAGDTRGAIEIMEWRLAMNEATLSSYDETFDPPQREEAVNSGMLTIAEYRKANPSPMPPNKSLERTRER